MSYVRGRESEGVFCLRAVGDRYNVANHCSTRARLFCEQQQTSRVRRKESEMKIDDLQKAVAKAQQELQLSRGKALELQAKAKLAKVDAEKSKLAYKKARKAAKQAKKLAVQSEEKAREQTRLLEKAQKRLAKAVKKASKSKALEGNQTKKAKGRASKAAVKKPTPSKGPNPVAEVQAPTSPIQSVPGSSDGTTAIAES